MCGPGDESESLLEKTKVSWIKLQKEKRGGGKKFGAHVETTTGHEKSVTEGSRVLICSRLTCTFKLSWDQRPRLRLTTTTYESYRRRLAVCATLLLATRNDPFPS